MSVKGRGTDGGRHRRRSAGRPAPNTQGVPLPGELRANAQVSPRSRVIPSRGPGSGGGRPGGVGTPPPALLAIAPRSRQARVPRSDVVGGALGPESELGCCETTWLGSVGLVVLVELVAVVFFPLFALLAWVLVVSGFFIARPETCLYFRAPRGS